MDTKTLPSDRLGLTWASCASAEETMVHMGGYTTCEWVKIPELWLKGGGANDQ